jgi:hypothetical protein
MKIKLTVTFGISLFVFAMFAVFSWFLYQFIVVLYFQAEQMNFSVHRFGQ